MPRFKALLLSLATLSATAFGQTANQARPGTLNYIEGQASIEGRPITPSSAGNTTLQAGQVLATANGKTEVLLTPGIFVRLGDNSTVQMVSPDLTHTEIRLDRGRANVEVDQIYPQNTILIDLKNGQTQLLKAGLYSFDADNSIVRVFDGQAAVYPGADLLAKVKPIDVKGGRQLTLNAELLKPQRFNKDVAETDSLYKWSSLRSNYLGEANLNLAEKYAGYPNFYPGWYWAGGPFGYTWLPGAGLFWSPFGYGFYSPYYLYGGGFVYNRGFYGRSGYATYRGSVASAHAAPAAGFRGGGGAGRR
ncbi:MAG: FecR domain-containing protein [Edaphobacter sp.]